MTTKEKLVETITELIARAHTRLPDDVVSAIKAAKESEDDAVAVSQFEAICENLDVSGKEGIPMCQDTGFPIFYVKYGCDSEIPVSLVVGAITESVKIGTKSIPLRSNIVHPLTRENTGDNTGLRAPLIHTTNHSGSDRVEITYLPKGAGSENMSVFTMLTPAEGVEGLMDFVVASVRKAGGKPCPPIIVGVGVGGTADESMVLAKKALLRPIDVRNNDPEAGKLEEVLLEKINDLGVGPMGLGGKTTALAVNLELAGCHTASLPVAVNIQCWAARKSRVKLKGDEVEWLQ